MSAAKFTPWFPADVKPVRVGFYQRMFLEEYYYWFWNGHFWESGGFPHLNRTFRYLEKSPHQELPWRGQVKP